MNNKINFDHMNDEQKTFLTLMPYIDINEEGLNKICNNDFVNVSELRKYLKNPEQPYFGKLFLDKQGLTKFDSLRGKDSPLSATDEEMINHMIEIGLGDIQLIGIRNESGVFCTGFRALALKDDKDNVGISYCGSHFDATNGAIREWLEANILEYFRGTSSQVKQAQDFFNEYKHQNGNTYIFGASLGGNLSQHIYNQHYREIAYVFTVNGNPINQKAINTPEKIAAFNNPEKASFNIICGDVVSLLKNCDLYPDTVHYVKNNGKFRDLGGLESHLLESAKYDKNHNFVQTTREEALEMVAPIFDKFTAFARNVRETLNDIENKHEEK